MEHIYQNVNFGENWFSYPRLYSEVVKKYNDNSRFVEIGSWKGKSSSYMAVEIANSKKQIDFYCVDTWEGSIEHTKEQKGEDLYKTFIANMKPVEEYYFPIKLKSIDVSKKFRNNSLDFVFVDASHEYKDVKQDLIEWLPKVKDGGILAGHDYADYFPGVIEAVNEVIGKENIIISEDCFIYYKNKLNNFPPINVISIEESIGRRNNIQKYFDQYNLKNINYRIFSRYKEGDCKLTGSKVNKLSFGGIGPITSHLKAIKEWLFTTNDEYAFFCEDDLSLETVKFWNFNWEQFYSNIPKNYGIVQLVVVREPETFYRFGDRFRNRCWCDWSAAGYLITRKFAKKLIENYYPKDTFNLEYVGVDKSHRNDNFLIPTVETVLFTDFGEKDMSVYSFPLFAEDIENCVTTNLDNLKSKINNSPYNFYSYQETIKFWKNIQKHHLDYIFSHVKT